jgi:hypothetical protein
MGRQNAPVLAGVNPRGIKRHKAALGATDALAGQDDEGVFQFPALAMGLVNPVVVGMGSSPGAQVGYGVTPCDCSVEREFQLPPATEGGWVLLWEVNSAEDNGTVYVSEGSGDTVNGITDILDWPNSGVPAMPLFAYCQVDGNWLVWGQWPD